MKMKVHVGADRASVNASFDADRNAWECDEAVLCSDGPGLLLAAVQSQRLLGGGRHVWCDLDGVTDAELAQVAASAASSDAVIVARSSEMNAKTKKILEPVAQIITHAKPSMKDVPARIDALAAIEGVRLSNDARRELVERCGHDLDRARSVLVACRLGALLSPSERHIAILSGSSQAPGVPWDVSDAIERGDIATAIKHAERCEPLGVIGYLSGRLMDAALLAESGVSDAKSAAEKLGNSPWQAEKLLKLSKVGSEGLYVCVRAMAKADRECKRGNDEHAMNALIDALMTLKRELVRH